MFSNQFDPNREPNDNQFSEEELEQVAGGGLLGDLVDAGKDFVGDVIDEGKEFISDVGDVLKKRQSH